MTSPTDPTAARRGALRWLIRESLGVVVVAVILFVSAGRWDWAAGWGLTAIYAVWVAVTAALIMPLDPALLAERATQRPERGWDKVILSAIGLLTAAAYIAAGLDVRNAWGPDMPELVQWAGGVLAMAGYLLVAVSMRANAFFSTVSRIQNERGHRVATGGPYRVVRHPGYVGRRAHRHTGRDPRGGADLSGGSDAPVRAHRLCPLCAAGPMATTPWSLVGREGPQCHPGGLSIVHSVVEAGRIRTRCVGRWM